MTSRAPVTSPAGCNAFPRMDRDFLKLLGTCTLFKLMLHRHHLRLLCKLNILGFFPFLCSSVVPHMEPPAELSLPDQSMSLSPLYWKFVPSH